MESVDGGHPVVVDFQRVYSWCLVWGPSRPSFCLSLSVSPSLPPSLSLSRSLPVSLSLSLSRSLPVSLSLSLSLALSLSFAQSYYVIQMPLVHGARSPVGSEATKTGLAAAGGGDIRPPMADTDVL